MKNFLVIIYTLCLVLGGVAFASDEHKDEHKDEHEHGHSEEEGHSEGETGFSLSPEASKNFELQTVQLKGKGPWSVIDSAVLYAGEEVNVYRLRDAKYERIDFKKISQIGKQIKIQSKDLQENDHVVTQGVGFLRIVEIVSSGGMPHGHSH